MATHFNLQHQLFNYSRSVGLDIRQRTTAYANSNALYERNNNSLNSGLLVGSLSVCYTSLKKCSSLAASTKAHFSCTDDQSKEADEVTNVTSTSQGMKFNRVDCVVWLLHESSRSFSEAINSLGLARSGPALAMAWIGKDVHEWHRRIAYQVAVHALIKAAIGLEILLSHERLNEFSPVKEILSPIMNQIGEHIEIRLKMKHPYLVQWFRETEMPRIAGYFIPLLKKWSVEYAGSYLECGSLFVYPEFSSIRVYQCFMEVVTDEIGWLDFYGSYVQINCKEKRSKHNARQAEKEIISSVVFTVCYDVFSGFAHFNRSTQQSLDTASRSYLLRCQGLLSICLQYHWAAYDNSGESLNTADHAAFDNHTSYMGSINGPKLPLVFEVQQMPHDLTTEGCPKNNFQNSCIFNKAPISAITNKKTYEEDTCVDKSNPQHESFIKRYSIKLASTSADLWMGIVLLFIDIMVALEILVRQVHGCKASGSQRKRLNRTMTDIIVLIPVTILMLIPVTAVGHAAILAAIKKYMPCLIPSSFSSERLDVVKQIKRTREMGYQLHLAQFDLEDQPATTS
ncbi:hypothetical protein glysoja_036887 [Glycine soja]|uniref:Uncharacterized protein n=1 Tax=Glycine soja TaxID=3848 RepID=A0A0B2P816_GLYSO|nr:hypothetical protein glysoja_036887 [Glycine soja]